MAAATYHWTQADAILYEARLRRATHRILKRRSLGGTQAENWEIFTAGQADQAAR